MNRTATIAESISILTKRFQSESETARLDAQNLVAHAVERDRSWVLAHPEVPLTDEQLNRLNRAAGEVELGTPLPYVLGSWEFYGTSYAVSPAVLIPRPETEHLVETAIKWYRKQMNAGAAQLHAVDVGTGSGCIAVSIAAHAPNMSWTAGDISRPALNIARQNAKTHHVDCRINFVESDLLTPFDDDAFDLVCANLPYIPTGILADLPVFQREPVLALDGGPDGLDLIRGLLAQAQTRLSPGGLILAEIEASQGKLASAITEKILPHVKIEVRKDYAGHDRLLVIQLTEEGERDAN